MNAQSLSRGINVGSSFCGPQGKQEKNADLQGSAPLFEEDFGVLGIKKELNCVPMLPDLMQKGVYLSYTLH